MPLVLHNTLTRRKEVFEPLDPKNVRMYVCGPTVYDFAHIGNARPVIVFDVLYRLLRHAYGAAHVRYVRNITDVDDKINAAAKANDEDIRELTERTAAIFHEDVAALGALPPDVEPRATEHIKQMIDMIQRLIASGHAYEAEGHVLFAVASMSDYGRLSGRTRDEMIAGARVEVAPYKRHPADFVLWKPSPDDLPGWASPWGRGRPGWHIECSAMSEAHLGETFDIHGGGLDIIFPHHENEVAQSVSAHHGKPFVRYWVHNALLLVNGEKMSKSLGNFRTIREVVASAWPEVPRTALLLSHYRDPLDWNSERLHEAHNSMVHFYIALRDTANIEADASQPSSSVIGALEDDLNTPLALRAVGDLVSKLNSAKTNADRSKLKGEILASGALLGILQQSPDAWLKGSVPVYLSARSAAMSSGSAAPPVPIPGAVLDMPQRPQWSPAYGQTVTGPTLPLLTEEQDEIDDLVRQRSEARMAKNFAEADRIRNALAIRGILLEDGPSGTTWRRAT